MARPFGCDGEQFTRTSIAGRLRPTRNRRAPRALATLNGTLVKDEDVRAFAELPHADLVCSEGRQVMGGQDSGQRSRTLDELVFDAA
jgi:hypothetical protein